MYPNPYMKPSILATLKGINWQGLLDGTQKTLGVINQAIPVFYELKPMINNAKTLLNIVGAVNDNSTSEPEKETTKVTTPSPKNSPIFYI